MNAQEFVTALSEIPDIKNIDALEDMGLSRDFISEYVESLNFKRTFGKLDSNQDPIKELVANYNGETVNLGMITFDIASVENRKYFFFGRFETDIFAIHNETGEILLLDYEDLDHVIYYCASCSSFFLDAITLAAKFLAKLPFDDNLNKNQTVICEIAAECSLLGGGDKYLDFFKTLLGCNC